MTVIIFLDEWECVVYSCFGASSCVCTLCAANTHTSTVLEWQSLTRHCNSCEDVPFQYFNHVIRCHVQWAIGTSNPGTTVHIEVGNNFVPHDEGIHVCLTITNPTYLKPCRFTMLSQSIEQGDCPQTAQHCSIVAGCNGVMLPVSLTHAYLHTVYKMKLPIQPIHSTDCSPPFSVHWNHVQVFCWLWVHRQAVFQNTPLASPS